MGKTRKTNSIVVKVTTGCLGMVDGGLGLVMTQRYEISFFKWLTCSKIDCDDGVKLCDCTKNHSIVYLNGQIVWYVNYVSTKLKKVLLKNLLKKSLQKRGKITKQTFH